MDRERLDDWLERGILTLVLAILVMSPLAAGAVHTRTFLIVQGLVLGIAVLWLLRCWIKPKVRLLWPPICWAVLAFAAYAGFRYWTAEVEYVARQEVTQVFVYAFLFLAILNNLHSREPSQIITLTLVFTGMCVAGYAVYQFATGTNRVWHLVTPYEGRATGTFINPNSLAGFLELLLPLGLAFTVTGRLSAVGKVLVGYASLVMMAGIAFSLSRGGYLATALSLLVLGLVLLRYPGYRIAAALLLVLLLAGGYFFMEKNDALRKRAASASKEATGLNNRFELWNSATRMWLDHPWQGVGPGHFDIRFTQYRTQLAQRRPIWAHNDYLNTLADWGLVGFAIVLSAWICLVAGVARTWSFIRGGVSTLGDRKGNKFAFVIGASCGLLAILVHSFVDFNMHIPSNAMLVVTLMALLSGHLRSATDRYWFSGSWPLKVVVSLVLLGILAGLGLWERQHYREYVWLARAAQLIEVKGKGVTAPFNKPRLEALEQAFAVEPNNSTNVFNIAEAYRVRIGSNLELYEDRARQAMEWYHRVIRSNPYEARGHLGVAFCLDQLEEFDKAEPYIQRAIELDPNGFTTANWVGLHYMDRGQYAVAIPWFMRSRFLWLEFNENAAAFEYIPRCERRLMDAARPLVLSSPNP